MTQALEPADIERFRSLVSRRLGLNYDLSKLDQLAEVLQRRLTASAASRFTAYADLLTRCPDGSDELRALAEQLTVTETFFFRNPDNFHAFAERVLPDRLRARAAEKRLRIVSAGCASGEEPYTLAMALRDSHPELADWDVQILALDVNRGALQKAARGRYAAWSLRATPEDAKRRYFRQEGAEFVLDRGIREMVTFQERNLVSDDASFWGSLSCDVIFCRNVLMYFRPETMAEVVGRLRRALLPNGFLFLGHAETLRGVSHAFHLCHTHETFYYQRRSDREVQEAQEAAAWGAEALNPELAAVSELPQEGTSWVDTIRVASERIAALANSGGRPLAGTKSVAATPAAAPEAVLKGELSPVVAAIREERFVEALALLLALPARSRDEPEALLLHAVLQTNSGRLEAAQETCQQLLQLDELNAGAHYLMALCQEHAGNTSGAVEHDQTAAYLDGAFAMPRFHLGLLARRRGEMDAARQELKHALALLAHEDSSRLLLFGGGFSREALIELCRTELRATGWTGRASND